MRVKIDTRVYIETNDIIKARLLRTGFNDTWYWVFFLSKDHTEHESSKLFNSRQKAREWIAETIPNKEIVTIE